MIATKKRQIWKVDVDNVSQLVLKTLRDRYGGYGTFVLRETTTRSQQVHMELETGERFNVTVTRTREG